MHCWSVVDSPINMKVNFAPFHTAEPAFITNGITVLHWRANCIPQNSITHRCVNVRATGWLESLDLIKYNTNLGHLSYFREEDNNIAAMQMNWRMPLKQPGLPWLLIRTTGWSPQCQWCRYSCKRRPNKVQWNTFQQGHMHLLKTLFYGIVWLSEEQHFRLCWM